jgi:hypothetical protein
MSQQEFAPEPGSHGEGSGNGEDEIYYPQHPYYWSVKPENEGAPRDEPPSSYVESTISPGYQAQDNAANVKQGTYGTNAGDQQSSGNENARQQYAPDGDAFEQGYGPFGSYNSNYGWYGRGVPPYAQAAGYRRMQRRSPLRMVFLVLLIFLLIKPILILAGLFLATIGVLIGGALLFVLLMAFFVIGMGMFRMALWPGYRRRGLYWYRRGRWW